MANVVLKQKAIDDLNTIWTYTFEKWSEQQADKYYTIIKLSLKGIGKSPDIGKTYPKINKKLLGFKSGKHIIFYHLVSEDQIEVLRILHERMDLKNRISE